jgi:Protein of unknown function (DUF3800)
MGRYFVFADETGNNAQDQFLGIGCLLVPVEKIGEYHERLKSKYGQIFSAVKMKEEELVARLSCEDLRKFAKGRTTPYEMKFKNINSTTLQRYEWLISEYFLFSECHFCCLIIDRHANPIPTGMDYLDAYLNSLFMLVKNNVGNHEFIFLPDDISVPSGKSYESIMRKKCENASKRCLAIHRLASHSSLFLQLVDVLIGAVAYECKGGTDQFRLKICNKIQSKIGVNTLNCNFTKKLPNYFSVWIYKKQKQ